MRKRIVDTRVFLALASVALGLGGLGCGGDEPWTAQEDGKAERAALAALPVGAEVSLAAISETDRPATCPHGFVVADLTCQGSRCSSVSLTCRKYVKDVDLEALYRNGEWISGDDPKDARSAAEFIRGVSCSERYCASIQALFVETPRLVNTGSCQWSDAGSEDDVRPATCGAGSYVAGIRCQGTDCQDLDVLCCAGEMAAGEETF